MSVINIPDPDRRDGLTSLKTNHICGQESLNRKRIVRPKNIANVELIGLKIR